jgi:TolB protein
VYPAWSPDGRQIAFVSYSDGTPYIYVMNADGSHQTNLAFYDIDGRCGIIGLVWSPDGERIAFTPTHSISAQSCLSDIYVMNADGSSQTNLTKNPGSDGAAVWSPTIN